MNVGNGTSAEIEVNSTLAQCFDTGNGNDATSPDAENNTPIQPNSEQTVVNSPITSQTDRSSPTINRPPSTPCSTINSTTPPPATSPPVHTVNSTNPTILNGIDSNGAVVKIVVTEGNKTSTTTKPNFRVVMPGSNGPSTMPRVTIAPTRVTNLAASSNGFIQTTNTRPRLRLVSAGSLTKPAESIPSASHARTTSIETTRVLTQVPITATHQSFSQINNQAVLLNGAVRPTIPGCIPTIRLASSSTQGRPIILRKLATPAHPQNVITNKPISAQQWNGTAQPTKQRVITIVKPKLMQQPVPSVLSGSKIVPAKLPTKHMNVSMNVAAADKVQAPTESHRASGASNVSHAPLPRITRVQSICESAPPPRILNGQFLARKNPISTVSLQQLGVQCEAPKQITLKPAIANVVGEAINEFYGDGEAPSKSPIDKPMTKPLSTVPKSVTNEMTVEVVAVSPDEQNENEQNTDGQNNNTKSSTILDLRCNICLHLCQTYVSFAMHMKAMHGYERVCFKCHQSFYSAVQYHNHKSAGNCASKLNSDRPYVCIVPAPIVDIDPLNEKKKYSCKHCSHVMVSEKDYVQHAQQHATRFRCKLCSTHNAFEASEMQHHLMTKHNIK